VGTSDEALARAVNLVIQHKGGLCVVTKDEEIVLPLPVAGIMTPADGYDVARLYSHLDQKAKELGSSLMAPFMTLSFMALLVIPELKLSDQGLFDGVNFSFTPLFRESSPNE
jgi:adenine deaminase